MLRERTASRTRTTALLLAPEQLLAEAERVGDAGIREWTSLAMLDGPPIHSALSVLDLHHGAAGAGGARPG